MLDDLRDLMEADRWIDRVRQHREHLAESAELLEVETALRTLASRLQAIEAERRPARDAFNEAADRAELLRHRRTDLEEKLLHATAPARELTALQGELERVVAALDDAEDREISFLLALEPLDEVAAAIRLEAQPMAKRRQELQESVSSLRTSLEEELVGLRESRELVASRVVGPLRSRYDAALARSGVSGAARVESGRCDGCRIELSPLDASRNKSLTPDTFLDCPECGRILLTC